MNSKYLLPLSIRDAVHIIVIAANDYGLDWVDPNASPLPGSSCEYYYQRPDDDMPRHCIVGYVLNELGIDTEQLANYSVEGLIIDVEHQDEGISESVLSSKALKLLGFCQLLQDNAAPWGAIKHFAVDYENS